MQLKALNAHTSRSLQNSKFVLLLEILVIDNWDQTKQEKQIKFLRQAVASSGNLFNLSNSSRQHVALSGDCFSIDWVSQTRSLRMLIHLNIFLR